MGTNNSLNKGKRYLCPYCDFRGYRSELIEHVEEEHEDLIPKDYTASRVVYNHINKKDHGSCMICHKETKWDESKQRYDSLCGRPKCKEEYIKVVRSRMVKKYGTYNLLKDAEFQKKMLENRSISGKYKFADGGSVGYVGSYEKKFLEFMDVFLHIKSYDIMSPGPSIPYKYNGKEHVWITDFLYEPYNLVFDIKDGGDNPNTRDMKEYRAKQIAKEKAIAEYGDYNYIRLTDNKFDQLILIMMELKDKVEDDKPLIRINESYIEEKGLNSFTLKDNIKFLNKFNRNDDFIIKKGYYANRISNTNKETTNTHKRVYISLSKLDHLSYISSISDGGLRIEYNEKAPYGYSIKYIITKDLKLPSYNTTIESFIDTVNYFGLEYIANKVNSNSYSNIDFIRDYNSLLINEDSRNSCYYRFMADLVEDSNYSKYFFDSLIRKGYNAIIDENDYKFGNGFVQSPIIILDRTSYLRKVSDTIVTNRMVDYAYEMTSIKKIEKKLSIGSKTIDYSNEYEALFGNKSKYIIENANITYMREETRIEPDKLPKHIYHISSVNHNGEVFEPRKYDNDNVKNGMERYVSRVCFADSIQGCLYSIFPNGAYDADFYVHVPGHEVKVYATTKDDIYDSEITHELWVKEPVEMKCIGKIHVSGVSNKETKTIDIESDKVPYNKKKYHKCIWKWEEKYFKDDSLFE